MKRIHILILLFFVISSSLSVWAKAESPTESKSAESKSDTRALRAKSTMEEALVLMEIYGKIRKITGNNDRSELKTQLDQLNSALDEILAFKNSFTPKKLAKVEKELNHLKSCITEIGGTGMDQMKDQSTKLLTSLLQLISVIVEPAQDEKPATL